MISGFNKNGKVVTEAATRLQKRPPQQRAYCSHQQLVLPLSSQRLNFYQKHNEPFITF